MKVINVFAAIFATVAFLTLGSLFLIVAIHLLSVDDAVAKVREIYADPWRCMQTGMVGLIFIFVGLTFAKWLVKGGRQSEAVIVHGEMGPIVVSLAAIEDIIKKVIRRFSLVKECKLKTFIDGKDLDIRLRMVLWSGGDVPVLLNNIQQEIRERLRRVLGPESQIEISCDIIRIEESQMDVEERTVTV